MEKTGSSRAAFGHEKSRRVNLVGTGCVTGAVLGALLAAEHKKMGTMPGTDPDGPSGGLGGIHGLFLAARPLGTEGMEHINGRLLDALSQPDLDLYEAYIGRNMKWIC